MTEPNFTKITLASAAVHFIIFTIIMLAVKMKPNEVQKPILVNLVEPGTQKSGTMPRKPPAQGINSAPKALPKPQTVAKKQTPKNLTPKIQAKASPKEQPKPKVQEKPKPKEQANPKPKVQEKPKPKEQPKPKVQEKPKPKEQPKPKPKVQEKPKPKEQPKPKVLEKPKPQEQPKTKVEEKSKGKTDTQGKESDKSKDEDIDLAKKKLQYLAAVRANKAKTGSAADGSLGSIVDKGSSKSGSGNEKTEQPGNTKALYIYSKKIERKIKEQWVYPDPTRKDLHNQVAIKIQKDGKVINAKIESSSGDKVFDQSTLKAVAKASPLPPPPPELVESLIKDEIVVRFYL